MFSRRSTFSPVAVNSKSQRTGSSNNVVAAAAFRITEEPASAPAPRRSSLSTASAVRQPSVTRDRSQLSSSQTSLSRTSAVPSAAVAVPATSPSPSTTSVMSTHASAGPNSPGAMYVRALYDYEADDRTSLSFRQGDVIQVITQLESGWWDGIINDVRGWFPSNYCAVVPGPGSLDPTAAGIDPSGDELSEEGTDEDDEDDEGLSRSHTSVDEPPRPTAAGAGDEAGDRQSASFWIPQVTGDGRLYYYNTMTGQSTMDMPFKTPLSDSETGPPNHAAHAPDSTRPPPELMNGPRCYPWSDDDGASATGSESRPRGAHRKRDSHLSDGVSPAASFESLDSISRSPHMPGMRRRLPTHGDSVSSPPPLTFYDDGTTPPLTWNRLVENMRKSVEAYRQAISNADRAEYVRRAEDISDHLRLLLAAGSGTTDNHSGHPSVISTNKALYPYFRDMMSRFSKLVLSSHIAAADWPAPDSYSKCLQEAEGVLQGVAGFVEVARAQRGEDLPRLVPGFVLGTRNGGSWRSTTSSAFNPILSSLMDQDEYDAAFEAGPRPDSRMIERLDEIKLIVVAALKKVEEHLTVRDKIITAPRHEQISTAVCHAAGRVVEVFRPFIALVESINLSALGPTVQPSHHDDLAAQKQRLYDLVAGLVIACQTVAGPLSDEWADIRGEPLIRRLEDVHTIVQQLETAMSQVGASLSQLLQSCPAEPAPAPRGSVSSGPRRRPSQAFGEMTPEEQVKAHSNPKARMLLGLPPAPPEQPEYLELDHEDEISYDTKTDPPTIRGGTLTALVEQLTRHDRLDAQFSTTFLLTYRSFTSGEEFLDMLVRRFCIQPPSGVDANELHQWEQQKQSPIRLRVVKILKSWIETYWLEDKSEDSSDLLHRVHAFVQDSVSTSGVPGGGPLRAVVEKRLRGMEFSGSKRWVPTTTNMPAPIIPKNMKKLKFLDIDVTEFARQLTLIESKLYCRIKSTECLSKTWQKKIAPDDPDPAPNVKALILHSNQLTNWVAEMILTQTDVKKRVVVIKHFVSVADKCRSMNNFSTLTSIISALGTAPIHRLGRTWAQVNARTSATLEAMRSLMASTKNFGEYRETLHSAQPPCVPFFGVWLTDLTFIEDGIPGIIKGTNLINFAKRAKVAEVISDIQQFQSEPYPLQPVPELQEYILSNMQAAGDVHEMYDKSLAVEPREREDEKIARLLSESGFL